MSFDLSYAVVLSILCFAVGNIGYVKSDNSNCSLTGGQPEDCVKYDDCPVVKSLFENGTDSVTNITRDYLRMIHCGWFKTDTPMVCCPPDGTSLIDRSIIGAAQRPYKHKNLHLLTKHECGRSDKQRIIGGGVADLYEYPWMALLAYNTGKTKEYQCGGSLISDKYVLTAAHCITKQLIGVRIGEHNTSSSPDCFTFLKVPHCAPSVQDFQVEDVIKHDYVHETISNDIALIRLKGTVDLSKRNAHPICLPIYNSLQNVRLEGQKVYVAGWGLTEKEKPSDALLSVAVKINSNADCKIKYDKEFIYGVNLHLTDYKFCAGEAGSDACKGDSGGPLVHPGFYNKKVCYIQYGIVSYGSEICNAKTPGVYTKVTKYLDWILDNLKP